MLDPALVVLFVRLFWAVGILGAFLAYGVPPFNHWHRYGKLRARGVVTAPATTMLARLTALGDITVPKRFFLHFYVVGVAAAALALYYGGGDDGGDGVSGLARSPRRLCLALLLAQCARRLAECARARRSAARMHVLGYALGLGFYPCAALTFALEVPARGGGGAATLAGVALCAWGALRQHESHALLAALRAKGGGGYAIPRGGWFRHVSCPHYLAEILVYAGLALVACGGGARAVGPGLFMLLGWVVANLWVTARRTHAWYAATFGAEYTRLGRAALFPATALLWRRAKWR